MVQAAGQNVLNTNFYIEPKGLEGRPVKVDRLGFCIARSAAIARPVHILKRTAQCGVHAPIRDTELVFRVGVGAQMAKSHYQSKAKQSQPKET